MIGVSKPPWGRSADAPTILSGGGASLDNLTVVKLLDRLQRYAVLLEGYGTSGRDYDLLFMIKDLASLATLYHTELNDVSFEVQKLRDTLNLFESREPGKSSGAKVS